jgi:hypothetical protein
VSRLPPLAPSDKVVLHFGPPGDTPACRGRGALVPQIVGCSRVAVHATPTIPTAVGVVAGLLNPHKRPRQIRFTHVLPH